VLNTVQTKKKKNAPKKIFKKKNNGGISLLAFQFAHEVIFSDTDD
jgi:hypothetical protein